MKSRLCQIINEAYDNLGQAASGKRSCQDGTPVAAQQFGYILGHIDNRETVGWGRDHECSLHSRSLARKVDCEVHPFCLCNAKNCVGKTERMYLSNLKWAVTFRDYGAMWAAPSIGADGTVYVSRMGTLWAIDPSKIDPGWPDPAVYTKWKMNLDNSGYGAQGMTPLVGPDGTIFLATFNADRQDLFSAVNPTNGQVLWTFADPQNWTVCGLQSEPALGLDGISYA